jgi:hypothetical protein
MKRMSVMAGCVVMAMSLSAMGSTYNYAIGGMNLTNGDWSLAKSGLYWDAIFSPSLGEHQLSFTQVLTYGENVENRGAYVWTAPEGEVITSVQFYWFRSGDQSDYKATVFSQTDPSAGLDSATIAWATNGGGAMYADGTQTVSFDTTAGVKSVGIGFSDVWSAPYCDTIFNTISVTTATVPEPMSLLVISVGGLIAVMRKK